MINTSYWLSSDLEYVREGFNKIKKNKYSHLLGNVFGAVPQGFSRYSDEEKLVVENYYRLLEDTKAKVRRAKIIFIVFIVIVAFVRIVDLIG